MHRCASCIKTVSSLKAEDLFLHFKHRIQFLVHISYAVNVEERMDSILFTYFFFFNYS